jgi:nitroimidazol reductase NimA-like FMN-containing flavoprotein (pyridoxamine 5'-phosphate oxidase superfamily)
MTTPVTTLDQRFSDPAAAPTSWEETSKALESAGLFWISTVRADGRPHVTPLVAVWVDSVLYFCTGEAEQKAINLGANQHVVLTTGCNGWEGGLDIMVEGDAVRVSDDATLGRLAQAWTTKWDGQWHYEVRGGSFRHEGGDEAVLVFAVAPAKILAFGKGTFSHTRYRF